MLDYYKKLPKNFSQMSFYEITDSTNLDFDDYDQMGGGAFCPKRPEGIYADDEWKRILEYDKNRAKEYLEDYPNLNRGQDICQNSAYLKNSPAHNIDNLQGDFLTLAGYDEYGTTSKFAPLEFKSRNKDKSISAVLHPFGHCIRPDNKGWNFKKKIFSDFLNGCEKEVSTEMIAELKDKAKKIFSCLGKNISRKIIDEMRDRETNIYLTIDKLDTLLTTYEKDFFDCEGENFQKCRWQVYVNYLALIEGYKKIADDKSENYSTSDCLVELSDQTELFTGKTNPKK